MLSERAKIRLELEQKLNQIKYEGVPCGNILSYYLTLIFDKNRKLNSYTTIVTGIKKYIVSSFILKMEVIVNGEFSNKVLCIPSSTKNKSFDFFNGFFQKFNNYILFFEKDKDIISYKYSFKISNSEWSKNKKQNILWCSIKEIIDKYSELIEIDNEDLKELKFSFHMQCKKISSLQNYFKNSDRPHAILTEHDRQPFASILISVLKLYGIKSYTLIHGSIFPTDSYLPIIADYCFSWGKLQKLELIESGGDEERIKIGGNPKIKSVSNNQENIEKPKFDLEKNYIITIATNKVAERFEFINHCIQSTRQLNEQWKPYLKLHPLENPSDYSKYLKNENLFTWSFKLKNTEIITKSSIIVIHNSIFGFDSIYFGTPVIIFNPMKTYSGFGEYLISETNTPYFEDSKKLTKFLNTIEIKKINSLKWVKRQRLFIKKYCELSGKESIEKINEYIRKGG